MGIFGKAGGMGKIKQARMLADSVIGKKAQKAMEEDYAAWCVFVKGWPKDKKTPMKYIQEYLRKVYFGNGVASWRDEVCKKTPKKQLK